MKAVLLQHALAATCFVFFCLGAYQLFGRMPSEENACAMTYNRGRYDQVLRVVNRQGHLSTSAYKYRLFRFEQPHRRAAGVAGPMDVRGIPVLFVPGHLGDYTQVRSLALWQTRLARHTGARAVSLRRVWIILQ